MNRPLLSIGASVLYIFLLVLPAYVAAALIYPDLAIFQNILTIPSGFILLILELAIGHLVFLVLPKRFLAVKFFIILIFSLLQMSQVISLTQVYDYVNEEALAHVEMIDLILTRKIVFQIFVCLLLWLLPSVLLSKMVRKSSWSWKHSAAYVLLIIALVAAQNNLIFVKDAKNTFPVNRKPMALEFIKTLTSFYFGSSTLDQNLVEFHWDTDLVRKHGIFINEDSPYPLMKDELYHQALPFKRTGSVIKKPNVIIMFVESFNARTLGAYGSRHANISLSIDRFAARSLIVKNYVNHTFPTVLGLRGQLCSSYPQIENTAWKNLKNYEKVRKHLRCLPHFLNDFGYDTFYFGVAHPNDSFLDKQMENFGISKRYFYEDFLNEYLPGESPERNHYGNSDEQMLRGLRSHLEKNLSSNKPFFIAMSTIETHPGMPTLPKNQNTFQHISLSAIKNFDTQFGRFFDWFEKSEYAKNTILVLTADHAHVPNNDFLEIAGDHYGRNSYIDPITLIIRDPLHLLGSELKTLGTSLDIAPTLLQLLDHPAKVPNHFLGQSLFTDRPKYLGGLSVVSKSYMSVNSLGERSIEKLGFDCHVKEEKCRLYKSLLKFQMIENEDRLFPGSYNNSKKVDRR